ncbi:MAG: LTA synthase family protein [Nannocystaceae bacterium]
MSGGPERAGAWRERLPRPPAWAVALALLWTLEIYFVQEITLIPGHWQSLFGAAIYKIVRLGIDLLACAALLCALPRAALAALFAVNPLFYGAVILYNDYYQQPLSIHAILETSGEGVQVSNAVWGLVDAWMAVFVVTFAIKLGLLYRGGRRAPWAARRRPAAALFAGYVGLVAVVNPLLQPLSRIGTWDSVGGLGAIYGYSLTWLAELAYLDVDALRDRALARARALPAEADRLGAAEADFPLGARIVFLQVESLDLALVDFTIDGREVTPNLNRLWRGSIRYAVQAPKGTGSSDADFRALTGLPPSTDVPTYKIPGYPYAGSFVERLARRGFEVLAVHGVTGEFFNRRRAYEHMPFSDLIFREELVARAISASESWAIDDGVVLDYAAARVAAADGPHFALVITATSHIPFPLPPAEKVFFPGDATDRFAYFDSAHYVDRAIGRFVDALPPGTTVVLYGDHISKMENPDVGYEQRLRDGEGCVPFLIHMTQRDLRGLQTTADELALSCELTSLEAFRLVHRRIEAAFAEAATDAGPLAESAAPGPAEGAALVAREAY